MYNLLRYLSDWIVDNYLEDHLTILPNGLCDRRPINDESIAMEELDDIVSRDLPDIEKLVLAFGWITERFIEREQHEIEIARALNDTEALVRSQIKLEVMKHARSIFNNCTRRVMGRSAWDD